MGIDVLGKTGIVQFCPIAIHDDWPAFQGFSVAIQSNLASAAKRSGRNRKRLDRNQGIITVAKVNGSEGLAVAWTHNDFMNAAQPLAFRIPYHRSDQLARLAECLTLSHLT